MMTLKTSYFPYWFKFAAASFVLMPVLPVCAQNAPAAKTPAGAAQAKSAVAPVQTAAAPGHPTDRAQAYYHVAMASIYEDKATSEGKPEFIDRAIEEYKLALNADPDSPEINDSLAELYFRLPGHTHDAEITARNLLKISPNDVQAHKLLGRIYLRQLGEGENAGASASTTDNILNQAIAEFEKIVALTPNSVEDRMVLGQLYTVKHDPKKAEEQFKTAQAIEPDSEEVVLNLARLYAESGNIEQAAKVIEAVQADDRTAKMEFTLGAAYDQLKRPKDAISAYQRAADIEPGDPHTLEALAQALLNNNQLDEALKQYKQLAEADADSAEPLVHIAEIQRRQGKLQDALATIQKARKLDPTNLEAGYNEGLLLDVAGHFDEAEQTYSAMVDLTSHANGAYTNEERNNRGIFLERLGAVYLEQNKTSLAIDTYQKMIDMGGDTATRGFQGQVDAYRTDRQFAKAIEVSRKAVAADPKNRDLKLMLAGELADHGQADEGLAMAKSLLTNSDQDRVIWIAIGQIDIRLRRWKDAEDCLNKAEPLSTKKDDRIYLLFLRGELAERQKHFEPAERLFRQVLDLDPSNAMTLNYLGYMLADKGTRLPEALAMIRKAVDLDPGNGAYLDSLGWVYFKMGQYELAEGNLRQALERNQTDPTVHEHMGDLYEKTGRIRQAATQWELSLAEYAKSSPADIDPGDVSKVQKKLDSARVKLAKQDSAFGPEKPE
ncbi:MAG TPA: tetratricopeptide repeat protein [Terracidiphilus sp.]|nr:tetratricopeptide repeat protein [Terracidiphilus sp.]